MEKNKIFPIEIIGQSTYNRSVEGIEVFLFAYRELLPTVTPDSLDKNQQNVGGSSLWLRRTMIKISGVYEIVNTINGKRYIGSSTNMQKRWSEHKRKLRNGEHHCLHLQSAWDKYGENNFVFKMILYCDSDNVLIFEQICIDGFHPEYNSSKIAGRVEMTPEVIAKMSASLKGIPAWNKGVPMTDEQKKHLSEATMGRTPWNKGLKGVQAGWNKGLKMPPESPEGRANRSKAHIGKPLSESHRANIGKGNTGRNVSIETREKMSLSHKGIGLGRKHSSESIEKMKIAQKGRTFTDEHKLKISVAAKLRWQKEKEVQTNGIGI